jgi:two-component system heavy metal sensor histidine kinase CusS
LTFGLGLVSFGVFALAGLLLHWALESELATADRAKLDGKMRTVQHFIEEAARSGDRSALFHHLDDLRIGHPGLHVWLETAQGGLVYGGPATDGAAPRESNPGASVAAFDLTSVRLPPTSPWPGGTVRVAAAVGEREALLRQHAATLLAVCAIGVAATVALSWFAIRRCLGIVTRLSGEAASITARQLNRRLTEPADGVELTGLVRAFNLALQRLESSYDQLRTFNANVAHELRTPLASMIAGTQVALSSPRSREDLRDALASNLEELELLKALVADMLLLSRADRGDRAEGLEKVDLGAEVDRAIHYCEAMLHDAGSVARREGEGHAECNPPLIRRAIVNLLTNAIRHGAQRGTIVVRIGGDAAGAQLGVENPGDPIAPHVREQMFDRFFRGARPRGSVGGGHGLGLAIVAAIARMHGGSVFCDRVGANNRVGFTLPVGAGGQNGDERLTATKASRIPSAVQ